jgi:long-subunit fatty acid transport protein
VPVEKITLTGSYTLSENNIETPVSYKRYHSYDLSSLFVYDDIPYDAENQVYSLTMSYLLNHKVSLTGEVTYTRSASDFDSYLNSKDIGNLSDLKINRLDTALGVTYLYSSRMTLSAKYMFREYNDKNDNSLDGQFNGISVGFNWFLK